MRRMTLILSDLYMPEEASGAGAVTPLLLPGLTELLRVASTRPALPDWRAWLAAEIGTPALAGIPVAQVAARAVVAGSEASTAWLATPVHLSARLDHVRLVDRGLLTLAQDERAALCTQFAQQFGPQYQLHASSGRDLLLTGLSASSPRTLDPARLLDADVAPALPRGNDALELRKLGAEIEMWLHGSQVNAARERDGVRNISTLWLWGGGAPVRNTGRAPGRVAAGARFALHGSDSFLAGLAHDLGLQPLSPAPAGMPDFKESHLIVELAPMSGITSTLASVDERWCVPARAALESGALSSLDILANDTCFRITPAMRWRFWRRRRSWFENVAGRAQSRKA